MIDQDRLGTQYNKTSKSQFLSPICDGERAGLSPRSKIDTDGAELAAAIASREPDRQP